MISMFAIDFLTIGEKIAGVSSRKTNFSYEKNNYIARKCYAIFIRYTIYYYFGLSNWCNVVIIVFHSHLIYLLSTHLIRLLATLVVPFSSWWALAIIIRLLDNTVL